MKMTSLVPFSCLESTTISTVSAPRAAISSTAFLIDLGRVDALHLKHDAAKGKPAAFSDGKRGRRLVGSVNQGAGPGNGSRNDGHIAQPTAAT